MCSSDLAGWALGSVIRSLVPGSGLWRFIIECALWLAVVGLAASPLASKNLRSRLQDAIPR